MPAPETFHNINFRSCTTPVIKKCETDSFLLLRYITWWLSIWKGFKILPVLDFEDLNFHSAIPPCSVQFNVNSCFVSGPEGRHHSYFIIQILIQKTKFWIIQFFSQDDRNPNKYAKMKILYKMGEQLEILCMIHLETPKENSSGHCSKGNLNNARKWTFFSVTIKRKGGQIQTKSEIIWARSF